MLLESIALLPTRLGLAAATTLARDSAGFLVEWIDDDLHASGVRELKRSKKRHVSLVDHISFLVMRRRRVTTVFAFDPEFTAAGFQRSKGRVRHEPPPGDGERLRDALTVRLQEDTMATSAVQLAVSIPQTFPDRPVDASFIRRYLTRAEGLGFHSAWVVEPVLGSMPSLEPIGLLTYAAAVTERMRLGSAVLLTALRSPVHTAKSLATLDQLSGGRLDVGVGLGGNPGIYPAFGFTSARRAARFTEGLRLMKTLWTEPRVTFAGEFWALRDATMEPKPVQRPHPPLWFGAHHPNALRRTVELGDAFMGAGSLSTAKFAEEVTLLRRLLAEAGRDPGAFPIGKRVYIAIDRDAARAEKRLTEWFGAFYGRPQLASEVSVWGSVETCVDGLRRVAAAGARLIMLNPVFDELEHLEQFAADVVPRLR